MSNAMTEPPYLEALRQQEQADMDGTMVRVSRQAVDEAIADIERLRAALMPFAKAWQSVRQVPEVWRWLSLGQLGALAQSEVSGSHFQRAATALGEPTPQPMEKVKDGGGYTS
jgi:hypothetical protein